MHIDDALRCELPSCGKRWTPTEIAEWAADFVALARSRIGEGAVTGNIMGYRYPDGPTGAEYLVAGFWNQGNRREDPNAYVDLAFLIDGPEQHRFHLDEPSVPDAAEAIHRIGLVAAALGAHMTIGMMHSQEERNPVVAGGSWFWLTSEEASDRDTVSASACPAA